MNGPRSILTVKDLVTGSGSAPISFGLEAGERMAVVGPAGSGKSEFLRLLSGEAQAPRGCVWCAGEIALASLPRVPPLATAQSLVQRVRGRKPSPSSLTEALTALGLWEHRKAPLARLSPSQRSAAELLPFLAVPPQVLLVDGLLEELDPWSARAALQLLDRLCSQGMALVCVTRNPAFAQGWDAILALHRGSRVFLGSIQEFQDRLREVRALVSSDAHPAARALLEPFQVRVEQRDGYTWLIAPAGQETAAKLLVEGYTDVEAVAFRSPTLAEALFDLIPEP
ncbi:MAG: ATP-binding cassette domain-containing protein [Fimbriimonadaceae bacterium]